MIRRTCPYCEARSYSACESYWECPMCGENLTEIPNDQHLWDQKDSVLESNQIDENVTLCQNQSRIRLKLLDRILKADPQIQDRLR